MIDEMIFRAIEAKSVEPPRPHLGASIIGDPCDRRLWLAFRWAVLEKFSGRILRLFRRGKEEERFVIDDLRAAGFVVHETAPEIDQQFQVKDGHFGGSLDGMLSGMPGGLAQQYVLEIKTHGETSFKSLTGSGVKKSKPVHYAQMQVYMHMTSVSKALYVAVNKNDDSIYTEVVDHDKQFAQGLIDRAKRIIDSARLPEPLSTDSSWYQCKFCPAHSFCHKKERVQSVNCRTCARSTPKPDGSWHCDRWDSSVPLEVQYKGCDEHIIHPDLVPWEMSPGSSEHTVYWKIGEKHVLNGSGGFKSAEILSNPEACVSGDANIEIMRSMFGAEVRADEAR